MGFQKYNGLAGSRMIGLYVLSVLLANLTLNRFIALPLYGQLSVGTVFFLRR